jgi:hypothetical protein
VSRPPVVDGVDPTRGAERRDLTPVADVARRRALVALILGTHVAGRRLGIFGPEPVAAGRTTGA